MTFIELDTGIREYRRHRAIHHKNVLGVLLPRDNFDDLWADVKPGLKFYEEGRRRIRWLIDSIGGIGYICLNILRPDPDDAHGAWVDLGTVTWQQIVDNGPPNVGCI